MALLKEILAFQNALLAESHRSGIMDITVLDVDVNDYPKVKAFMDRTNAYHDSRERSRGSSGGVSGQGRSDDEDLSIPEGAHRCGNKRFPVPNEPPRIVSETGDGERYFLANGYHVTDRYARTSSAVDYTKARDLYGPYGYCAAPMFRYHGWGTGANSYSIQTPEPNPEVGRYVWPYPSWLFYVMWWHDEF